ncbi:MAG: endonuclease V [Haloarculaceae archaeon]
MDLARPALRPDPGLSREEMERQQRDIAAAATFTDYIAWPPAKLGEQPLVAGVDQGFDGDTATSAAVVLRGETVVDRAHATRETEIPYIPGLLSFREGNAVLAALTSLETDPDVILVDGSGRIHFREAGLATHVGVVLDAPTVGVAKNLLCGRPSDSLADPLPEGERVAIEADDGVTAPDGTVIGYAVQTRQYDSGARHINPLYVSPGHRVSATTAADIVERYATGYKLPEPTRLADSYADEVVTGTDE